MGVAKECQTNHLRLMRLEGPLHPDDKDYYCAECGSQFRAEPMRNKMLIRPVTDDEVLQDERTSLWYVVGPMGTRPRFIIGGPCKTWEAAEKARQMLAEENL